MSGTAKKKRFTALALVIAAHVAGPATAQAGRDDLGCLRPVSQFFGPCNSPGRKVRDCLADVQTQIQQLDEWEACVATQMGQRHADESKRLVEDVASRRKRLLDMMILAAP
jgi:hypothetical protein